MLLDIVVIVVRETLEASLLIGVLLSLSRENAINFSWLFIALITGAITASLYSMNLGYISDLFDYVGQEVINAAMQYSIYLLLVVIIALQFIIAPHKKLLFIILFILAVSTAITREAGELFVFYSGFLQSDDTLFKAITSGFIGFTIGLSAAAIGYYSLAALNPVRARSAHTVVLTLFAGGMVMQATQQIIQADWLTTSEPVWNSNKFIAEESVVGQILSAAFGYESTPSKEEVIVYSASILLIMAVVFSCKSCSKFHSLSTNTTS
jgi:high-affinity iron transporter